MDALITYALVIILCLYQMIFEADDKVFLFYTFLLCILMPCWVRLCMRWGKDHV